MGRGGGAARRAAGGIVTVRASGSAPGLEVVDALIEGEVRFAAADLTIAALGASDADRERLRDAWAAVEKSRLSTTRLARLEKAVELAEGIAAGLRRQPHDIASLAAAARVAPATLEAVVAGTWERLAHRGDPEEVRLAAVAALRQAKPTRPSALLNAALSAAQVVGKAEAVGATPGSAERKPRRPMARPSSAHKPAMPAGALPGDASTPWTDLVDLALAAEGGRATLRALYARLAGHPKCQGSKDYRATLRGFLQRNGRYRKIAGPQGDLWEKAAP